jgi:hypothetical protein
MLEALNLFKERAQLEQSYDAGHLGRFQRRDSLVAIAAARAARQARLSRSRAVMNQPTMA